MIDPKNWMDGGWMQTFTGRMFDPSNPQQDQINILDIAHGLSLTCRYGGQSNKFYSVAEHCVRLAQYGLGPAGLLGSERIALAKDLLMHDAAEAYVGDMPYPVKQHLNGFKALEDRLDGVIRQVFGHKPHPLTKELDRRIALDEMAELMPPLAPDVVHPMKPLGLNGFGWSAENAEYQFIGLYRRLFNGA